MDNNGHRRNKSEIGRLLKKLALSVGELILTATAVCRRSGHPVDDPEYESAINLAVFSALQTYKENGPRSLTSLCSLYALRQCEDVRRELESWWKQDQAGAQRGTGAATETPIPIPDFELISFVAAHGRKRAAKLLSISPCRLRAILDEIALRINPDHEAAGWGYFNRRS